MANAEDIAQVKQQITEKINSVSGNIKAINNFTQSLNQALRFLTTKITELKVQGAEGQQRAQQLYEELNAILNQLNGIDEVSPDFVNAINSIIQLANQEKPNDQNEIPALSLQAGGRKSRKSRKSRKLRKSRKMKKGGYRYNKKSLLKKKSPRRKIRSR